MGYEYRPCGTLLCVEFFRDISRMCRGHAGTPVSGQWPRTPPGLVCGCFHCLCRSWFAIRCVLCRSFCPRYSAAPQRRYFVRPANNTTDEYPPDSHGLQWLQLSGIQPSALVFIHAGCGAIAPMPGRGNSGSHAQCASALGTGGRFVSCSCVACAGGGSSSGGSLSSAAAVAVVTAALVVLQKERRSVAA